MKLQLCLYALSPVIIGYLYNLLVLVPGLGSLLFWCVPFLLLIYWFCVGRKFAVGINNPVIAIIIGNIFGIISVLIYYWEFIILTDVQRNLWLAGFSQCFSATISPITSKIGILFETEPYTITQTTINLMQFTGFILMVFIFSIGYFVNYKRLHKSN